MSDKFNDIWNVVISAIWYAIIFVGSAALLGFVIKCLLKVFEVI